MEIKTFWSLVFAFTQLIRTVISPESITSSCPLSWRRISRPDSSRFIAVPVMMTGPRLTESFFPNKSVLSFHFLITECPPSAKKKRYSRSRVVSNDRITVSRFIGDPFTILREVAVFFKFSGNCSGT